MTRRITAAFFLLGTTLFSMPAAAQDFSAEVFGGIRFDDNLNYGTLGFDTDSGTIFGVRGLYHATPNLAFGLELNATTAQYTGFETEVNARSVMALARYSVPVSDTVDVYGTLGLGSIRVEYDGKSTFPTFTGHDNVAGGQISLGVAMDVAPNVGLFGELIYQTAFDDAIIVGQRVEYESTNLAVGVRFRF